MITLLKSDLDFALRAVTRVMETRPATPIMRFCRLRMHENYLYIDAGGHGNWAFTRVPATGGPIEGCVDPRILLQLLKRLPDEIVLKPQKNKLVIQRPSGNISLATAGAEHYPPGPVAKDAGDWISIPREAIRDTVTSLLCGTDEEIQSYKKWQNVVLIRSAGPEFLAVASDGVRTALVDGKCSSAAGVELIVPLKALRGLHASVNDLPADVTHVEIGQDAHHVWIRCGSVLRLVYAKIHTDFPDIFGKVLNVLKFDREVRVESADFEAALDLVRTVGDEKIRSFRFEASAKGFLFATDAKDRGTVSETIGVKMREPFEFVTGYNADFLRPIFQQTGGEVAVRFAKQGINYPMQIVHEGAQIRSSWLVQSLQIFPGGPKPVAAEVKV